MKYPIVIMFILISLSALSAQESSWVSRAIDCTPEAAELFMREVQKGAGAEADLCMGIVYHNLAMNKPESNADKSIALLEAVVKKTGNPLARGYWGSALTLKASGLAAKGDYAGAASLVAQGIALIDEAVAAAPGMTTLRFLRASNGLDVSGNSPFKRYDVVAEDIRILETSAEKFSPEESAGVQLMKGELLIAQGKIDEGIRALEQAVRSAPESASAQIARKKLALLDE
jgi:tetratricopeptide (TPR) repeat protein